MAAIDEKVKWPGWETVRLIGRGSFGGVYEIERDVFGHKEKAALKVITIPQSESDIDDLLSDGYDEESITTRFEGYLHDIVREYSMMADMKGCVNIVYCDDVKYIQHDNGIGWDIFIKMELLTPLTKALGKTVSDEQAIKIATDICSALAFCEKKNLLHRDIKPQNIFVSPDGTYKLGDFGIAKTAERTTSGTKTGTYKYMAPEVYNNQPYGSKADIYSLGLVLYWLLNERRTPFLPLPPQLPSASDEDRARTRRFSGETIPTPAHGSTELKRIVLKACAYDPKDRYQTADEMLHDLNTLGSVEKPQDDPTAIPSEKAEDEEKTVGAWVVPEEPATEAAAETEEDETVSAWAVQEKPATEVAAQPEEDKTVGVWTQKPETKKPVTEKPASAPTSKKTKKKKWWFAAVAAVAVVAVIFAITGARPEEEKPIMMVSGGGACTVGLKSDGTVVAAGDNSSGECNVADWIGIVAVSAGASHTVGLRSDGTVVAVGDNDYGQCDVSGWRDIVAVSAGAGHTVGLKADGTVVAVGDNVSSQCQVADWNGIVAVSAGVDFTVGVKSDGSVVAVGYNPAGQCDVDLWKDVVAVSAGYMHTIGLKNDGTVDSTGWNDFSQCGVSEWKNIVAVSAGYMHSVGLKSDGTVVVTGSNDNGQCNVSGWKDIIAISAGSHHTVGLKSDGTVVAVGASDEGQCKVSGWQLLS